MPEWTRDPVSSTGSRIHVRLHDTLVDLGYYVEDEATVGRYSLDCYVRELHLGFEADGLIYHKTKRQLEQNTKRDAWILVNAGIPILRIPESRLKTASNPELLECIELFTNLYVSDIDVRRQIAEAIGGF